MTVAGIAQAQSPTPEPVSIESGGYTYANGSGQNMGLWNTFTTTTLKMTGPNYYVIGTCP